MFPFTVEYAEHPLAWIARKSHKTCFVRPGTSSPANNSELLYDGSAEARQTLVDAIPAVDNDAAYGALGNVLDYLKGKDIRGRFSFTRALLLAEEDLDKLMTTEPLVQIQMPSANQKKVVGWSHPRVVEEDGSFEPTPPSC